MKLSSLSVQHYRGFASAELAFEPDVTVLVGVNGAGKTSLLDAAALMLSYLAAGIRTGRASGLRLHEDDIRVGSSSASVTLRVAFAPGDEHSWEVAATRPGLPRARTSNLTDLESPIAAAQRSIAEGAPSLPLAVYYPTNRNALDIPDRIRQRHRFDAINAFDGALGSGERNFRAFFEWFREEEDRENQLIRRGSSLTGPDAPRLEPVRQAIMQVIPGARDLHVERQPQRMILTMNGTRLDVAQLSDGEKCLLATAGDLARRLVIAAPSAEHPLAHPAVVLIDEVELHLHPGLQRTVLPRLRKVFSNTQFVVSTHSPQVLSSVHASSVRLIENFTVRSIDRETWRRDTNRILDSVFGDHWAPAGGRAGAQRAARCRRSR